MSVFKKVSQRDLIPRKQVDELVPVFDTKADIKKTGTGWNYTKNSSFTDDPTISGSVYFISSGSVDYFYCAYAKETPLSDYNYSLNWNSLMGALSAPWNKENQQYDFYVNNTRITEAVIISYNPDEYGDTLDEDNFFVVMSGSSSDTAFTDKGGVNYDVSESVVLAPYYIKPSIDDANNNSIPSAKISPAYELRTTNSDTFLDYDESVDSIDIDWTDGTLSSPKGVVFPSIGIILVFPELLTSGNNETSLVSAIQSSGDRSLNSLNSIMVLGAYGKDRKEKTIVFSRLHHSEFNKTTNPSAFISADGEVRLIEDLRQDDAQTFITQVGFYNNVNECVAVGFLSKPIQKTFIDEHNFKIEIDH